MIKKLKEVKKYLSDKYYIEDFEWNIGISPLHKSFSRYGDNINVFILWSKDSSNIYLENVKSRFDILKIKNIIKNSEIYLLVNGGVACE